LMLKAEWESFLSEISGYSVNSRMKLSSILNDQILIEKSIMDFKPNKGKISNLVREMNVSSNGNITNSHSDFFVEDLLKKNTFLYENERIGKMYPKKDITEKVFLYNLSDSDRDGYFRAKELWMVKSTELDELLLNLERKKRLNMGIENKYFKTFGNLEIEKSKLRYRVEKYKIISDTMQNHPELSYRELIKLANEKLLKEDRERNDLMNKFARSLNYIGDFIFEGSPPQVTTDFKNSYIQACKKLLRKLFFLLHSDTCPQYSMLSPQKKSEINDLWLKLMKSTKNETYSYSPSMLLYSLPDYQQLESIYNRACEILEINPDDFEIGNRLEFMISKGTPIEEIMEFLKDETERLELHLAHLELIQNEYAHENQTQLYQNALANQEAHFERLRSEIAAMKMQIIKLKKKISNGFKEVMKAV
jgi:DNA-binding transcriptional MerR regulator